MTNFNLFNAFET